MATDKTVTRKRIRKKIEMDDDKLIECVRKNKSLYEADHCRYGDGAYRSKVWKAIGAELKRHPIFCKKRWGNIRDNFKKAMKKYNLKSEQGYTSMKKYKFCDKLAFLESQTEEKHKESTDYIPLEVKCEPDIDNNVESAFNTYSQATFFEDAKSPIEEHSTDYDIDRTVEHIENYENYSQADTRTRLSETEEADVEKPQSPKIENTTIQIPAPTKRKLDHSDCELTNSKAMRYIVERLDDDRFVERHPVDAFLAGIAPTLKSLSPYYLSLAKTQIYSIVQEYEMAMIMERRHENHPN